MPTDLTVPTGGATATPSQGGPLRVVLLHKHDAPADEQLLHLLEQRLGREGFAVSVDRRPAPGLDWARERENQVRTADVVVPLLSAASVHSEMLAFEVELAQEAVQQQGRPHLLPVRVDFDGPLPEVLATILDPRPALVWHGPADGDRVCAELVGALRNLPAPQGPTPVVPAKGLRLMPRTPGRARPPVPAAAPAPSVATTPVSVEPVGGAVPLHSELYIERPTDKELRTAIGRFDSTILIKGARQIGKTSILARGLQYGRERGAKVALTDFQKFNAVNLQNVSNFYLSLAESLADQLELDVLPSDQWDERRGPNVNFERFVRREVLSKLNAPLVWGLDEADRLFGCNFGSEVFGLFRSWHNERALDPTGPWAGLTLLICYATEAHLFITDMNQSPFNVGTRLALEDFTFDQVAELNRRHGSPLKSHDELRRFVALVGGHPYLVRAGLYELAVHKLSLDAFEARADRDDGVFADHLKRLLVLLAKDAELAEVVRGIIELRPCPTPESFYRLRSAGVVSGATQSDARLRCQIYTNYLARHLL
jgi:hypothetical protein